MQHRTYPFVVGIMLATALTFAPLVRSGRASAQSTCTFALVFRLVRAAIGPDIIGECAAEPSAARSVQMPTIREASGSSMDSQGRLFATEAARIRSHSRLLLTLADADVAH